MLQDNLRQLLEGVKEGNIAIEEALQELKDLPYKDLGFAKLDTHRELRQNYPETIYCQGKTPEQVREIMAFLAAKTDNIIGTRASHETYLAVKEVCPDAVYHPLSRMIIVNRKTLPKNSGEIMVISAGTSDLPVAEEAALTAEIMGNKVTMLTDVGVAGIHRLLSQVERIRQANVLIVVAGMEGALASVVGGLVSRPVIAVPTSVGYGANFQGLSALLAMLNSCAPGVGVVNIDNGFGAGRLAAIINEDRSEKL